MPTDTNKGGTPPAGDGHESLLETLLAELSPEERQEWEDGAKHRQLLVAEMTDALFERLFKTPEGGATTEPDGSGAQDPPGGSSTPPPPAAKEPFWERPLFGRKAPK